MPPKRYIKPKLVKPHVKFNDETNGEIIKTSDKEIKDIKNDISKLKSTVPIQKSQNKESGLVQFEEVEAQGYTYFRSFLASHIPSFMIDSNRSNPFYGTDLPYSISLEKVYQKLEKKFSVIDKVLWIHIIADKDKAIITFEKQLNQNKITDLQNNKMLTSSRSNRMGPKCSTFLAQYPTDFKAKNCIPNMNDECFLTLLKYLKFYDHMHLFSLSSQNRKLILKYYESNSTLRINRQDLDVKVLNVSWCVLELIGPSINKVIFEYDNCYDLGMEGFWQSILYYTKNIKELKMEKDPKADLHALQYFIKEKKIFEQLTMFKNIEKIELIGFGNKGLELTDLDIKNLACSLPELKILNLSQNENITGQHFNCLNSITELNIQKCSKILCGYMIEFIICNNDNLEHLNIIDCLNLCDNEFWNCIQKCAVNLRTIKFSIMPSFKLPNQLQKLDNLRNLTDVYIGNGKKALINYNNEILDLLETLTLSNCVKRVEIDSTIKFHIKIFLFIVNSLKKDKALENNRNKIQIKLGIIIDMKYDFQHDYIYLENRKSIKFIDSTFEGEGIIAAEYTFVDDNYH